MSLRRFLLVVLASAVATHLLACWALPRLVMAAALEQLGAAAGGANRLHHAERVDAGDRRVVRPSPDLAYSACVFDLDQGPLLVSLPVGSGYSSVAAYAANTDNFFTASDREARDGRIELVLSRGPESPELGPHAQLVRSPSRRGLVLWRTVAEDPASWDEIDELRRSARCETLTR